MNPSRCPSILLSLCLSLYLESDWLSLFVSALFEMDVLQSSSQTLGVVSEDELSFHPDDDFWATLLGTPV